MVSRVAFVECAGNGGALYQKTPAQLPLQGLHGLVSCAEWTGVPLAVLLDEAGIDPATKWVLAEGADAASMSRSVPLAKAMDDAVVALYQNGERIRPSNGYPMRLLLPGFEGNMNIKWLRRLKVTSEPSYTREETSKYTDLLASGEARAFTFVMEAKSVITSPSGGMVIGRKGEQEIRGLAWSGRGKIVRVDVSADAGRTWEQAALQQPVLSKCLVRFRAPWKWTGESAVLQSRCSDETGYVQPTLAELVTPRGLNSVYHLNAIQSWAVASDGQVTNVHA